MAGGSRFAIPLSSNNCFFRFPLFIKSSTNSSPCAMGSHKIKRGLFSVHIARGGSSLWFRWNEILLLRIDLNFDAYASIYWYLVLRRSFS
jgi:hypothetical protein